MYLFITGKKYGRDQYKELNSTSTSSIVSCGGLVLTLMAEKFVSCGIDTGTNTNVSSSHDHVVEFNREGAVPILHKITLIPLNIDVSDDDDNCDGQRVNGAFGRIGVIRSKRH